MTLEDLTVYVAQRTDKERESVIRQLSAPVDSVKEKLGEMENTLAGFQRTMHLVLSEVDADRERSQAIAVRGRVFSVLRVNAFSSSLSGCVTRRCYISCGADGYSLHANSFPFAVDSRMIQQ